jgi:hypothetical protein
MSVVDEISKLAGQVIRPLRAGADTLARSKEHTTPGITVRSASFPERSAIPARYAGERGIAPEVQWSQVPHETQEVVVLCEDPDAPFPQPYVHWVVYGLSPSQTSLPEGLAPDAKLGNDAHQGKNSAGRVGYTGPQPPRGHGVHHYHFQVFALARRLGLAPGADRDALVAAMHGHVIVSGEVIGTYELK